MDEMKIYRMLGLAFKAGKVVSGEEMTEKEIRAGKVFLTIVATDSSDNTIKRFQDKCNYRKVPLVFFGTKEKIGNAIGKQLRAVVALKDEGFAQTLMGLLDAFSASKETL